MGGMTWFVGDNVVIWLFHASSHILMHMPQLKFLDKTQIWRSLFINT